MGTPRKIVLAVSGALCALTVAMGGRAVVTTPPGKAPVQSALSHVQDKTAPRKATLVGEPAGFRSASGFEYRRNEHVFAGSLCGPHEDCRRLVG